MKVQVPVIFRLKSPMPQRASNATTFQRSNDDVTTNQPNYFVLFFSIVPNLGYRKVRMEERNSAATSEVDGRELSTVVPIPQHALEVKGKPAEVPLISPRPRGLPNHSENVVCSSHRAKSSISFFPSLKISVYRRKNLQNTSESRALPTKYHQCFFMPANCNDSPFAKKTILIF